MSIIQSRRVDYPMVVQQWSKSGRDLAGGSLVIRRSIQLCRYTLYLSTFRRLLLYAALQLSDMVRRMQLCGGMFGLPHGLPTERVRCI